ncbi:MAG TPA: aspartate aminotransferase family protein [Chloroflexota bacterium]|nr:aspartate aminotransferase family protein [Chloroflexota bacterium]
MDTQEKYAKYVNTSFVKSIEPVVFASAEGATVTAVDGRTYLDCFAGISVVNTGHRNPRVVAAAREQIDKFIHCASYIYYAPPVADLAERLAQITPGRLQKTFFGNSGAEAIEGSMRLARAYTGRHEFIALQMAFHGRTNATLAVTGNQARKTHGGPYLSGVAFAPAPYEYRCRFCEGRCTLACADAVEDVIQYQTGGDVAAFIAEGVMGEGGIIVPPEGYFQRVKEILDRHGILFIDDEVQSGFGRTGKMFAIEWYGVEPDIMAMAKGIADGFPLGAFIAPPEIADSFQPGEHLSTFGGNPVCCAAALANIDVLLEDRLPQHADELGQWTMARLRDLAGEHQIIGEVRGKGLMIGIELVASRETKEPAPIQATEIRRICRENGVLIGVGGQRSNVLRLQPPLTITRDQISQALDVLETAFASLAVTA